MAFKEMKKDPAAVLDYKWDFRKWLAATEVISSATVTGPAGITVDSYSITDGGKSVTGWLSAGTVNTDYDVVAQIVTSLSRTEERTIRILCRQT